MDGILSIRGPLKLLIVVGPSFGDAPHRIYCLGKDIPAVISSVVAKASRRSYLNGIGWLA